MNMSPEELRTILDNNPSLLARNKTLATKIIKNKNIDVFSSVPLDKNDTKSKKAKGAKYKNEKVYVYSDGFVSTEKDLNLHGEITAKYDSIKEYKRYGELRLLEKAGQISELQRQVKLVIQEAFVYRNEHISEISYIADFVYIRNDETVVEDVKGISRETGKCITSTKDFKLKWKLLKAKYPEKVFEIF